MRARALARTAGEEHDPTAGILCAVMLSRGWSAFLIAVGVWTWLIWPRFAVAIWRDPRSFADGTPTSFLWVHALLITASLVIGTAVGVLGAKGLRAARRHARAGSGQRNPVDQPPPTRDPASTPEESA